jgi:hypothetical protein
MPANTKTIKRRIKSVKNTKKITKAMELVSAAKMRRAVEAVQNWTEERELLLREACSVLYEDQEKYWRDAFFRMYHSLDDASKRASRLKSYLLD